MEGMTDIMVDIETTGTDPGQHAIIQIAAIKFCHDTGTIGETFDRCLSIAPMRSWDEDTRIWWQGQKKAVFTSIVEKMEPAQQVLLDFYAYALKDAPQGGLRFWCKPLSFDWPFLASYFRQHGGQMPFHYRFARDVNTYIAARKGGADHVDLDFIQPVGGDAHNALYDCVKQLKQVFAARDGQWEEVLP